MSIERVVALLTPVFGALSAWLTGLVAHNFPGVSIPAGDLTALEVAGFTGACAAALKWLHGRAQFVQAENAAKRDLAVAEAKVREVAAANPSAGVAVADLQAVLKAHEAAIVSGVEAKLPTLAGQVLQQLFPGLQKAAEPAGAPVAPGVPVGTPPPAA